MEYKKEKVKNQVMKGGQKSILNRINSNENLDLSINNEFDKNSDSKFISKLTKNIKNKQKMMKNIFYL